MSGILSAVDGLVSVFGGSSSLLQSGGALLGGLGSIGGGLLGGSEGGPTTTRDENVFSTSFNGTNPLLAALSVNQLAALGIVDPTQLLNAGPISQLLDAARRSGRLSEANLSSASKSIRGLFEKFMETGGQVPPGFKISNDFSVQGDGTISIHSDLQRLLGESDFGSITDLLNAETQFQQSIQPVLDRLSGLSAQGLERQDIIDAALLDLTQEAASGVGFDELKSAESSRLLRELDERRTDALSQANFSGSNPASRIKPIEEATTDSDLIATQRALGLGGAKQQLQANLFALLNNLDPRTIQPAIGGAAGNTSAQIPSGGGGNNSALGSGVANAGLILGSALLKAGQGSGTGGSAPGTSAGGGGSAFDQFLAGSSGPFFTGDLFGGN